MLRFGYTTALFLIVLAASAQNNFRSRQSGDWNQASTWEEFIAGSWQVTINTPSSASGTITIQSPHVVTVTANVTIDQATTNAGSTLIVNDGIALTLNQGSGTDLTANGTIQMLGESFIDGGGDLIVNSNFQAGSLNATGAILAGSTAGNIRVNNRTFNASARVIYNGTGAQHFGSGHPNTSGVITEVNNASGITFDNTTTGNPGGGLVIPGALIMTAGDIHISTISGTGRTLILRGTLTPNGNVITMSGPCSLRIEGSGALGTFPFPAGAQSMFNFVMNRPGETITFSNAMTFTGDVTATAGSVVLGSTASVTGTTTLNGGTIDFNGATTLTGAVVNGTGSTLFFDGQTLTMSNNYTATGGLLSSNSTSTLLLTGSTAHASALTFTPGSSLNTLSMTMTNAGTSASIGSALTVTSALNLNDGILDNLGGNLTLSSGATVTKNSEGSISTSSPSGGPWNLIYTNASQATGLEIPASGSLSSVTVSTNGGTTVTLGQSINVSGAFTITNNNRIFTSGANNVSVGSFSNTGTFNAPTAAAGTGMTISGNLVNNSVFNHNNGVITVSGPSVWSGTTINTTNFFTVNISGTGALTAPATLNVLGNMANDGTFTAGGGTVQFRGGTNTLSGATMPATSFANVTVNVGATLVPASNFILTGNLVMNGAYTAGAGTITFSGTTTLSGTNINTTQFNHVTISAAGALTAPTNLRVGGNFSNSGTFTAGATTTVEFTGTSALLGTAINTTNFNHILINGGAVTAPTSLHVLGNFTNNGTFTAGAGTVLFEGNSGAKTLSGTSNTQFFALTLNKTNGGTSLTVSSPQTVTSALTLTRGILDNVGGNLTLNAGGTLTRFNTGTITTSSPGAGPWNLIYRGATMTTALEIPASGTLTSLTIDIDATRTVNLNQSITVQNALSILNSGRTLACGTNNVTTVSVSNNGTITAPASGATTGLTVSGNFANNGTYTHNNGLITFSGTTNLSGTSTTTFNRITITGTLTALVNFGVAGHFTNNGTFNAGNSLVTFSGAALQNISGTAPVTTFRSIRITNTFPPVSVSVQSNVNLIDSLSLSSNSRFDADGSSDAAVFTLLSTSDAPAVDAKICRLPAGAQVLGNVTVQRFFRPADNFDRFFSSPVSNATVAQLQASTPAGSFPITGGFPGTSFPCTGCNNDGHNFRYYYEPEPGIINKGYKGFILATSNTLTPGVGYDAFMWNGVSNTTVSLRGPINAGSVVLGVQAPSPQSPGTSITRTNNGVPSADGWNLVGNPYPSPIQWNNGSGWTRSNIDPTVWVWDVVGRVWHSYNANTSSGDLTNGVIASGQGFWVYVTAVGTGSITVNENAKSFGVFGTGSYYRTQAGGRQRTGGAGARIVLSNGVSSDNVFLLSDPDATAGYDPGMDAVKLQLGIEQLSVSLLDESNLKLGHYAAGNRLPDRIPLYVFGESDGDYSIRFENMEQFSALEGYYLVDDFLGESRLIAQSGSYAFTMTSAEPLSQSERFFLSRYPSAEKVNPSLQVIAYPNPATDALIIRFNPAHVQEISLLDNSGRRVVRVLPSGNDGVQETRLDVSQQPAGLYILKVVTDGMVQTRKILVRH